MIYIVHGDDYSKTRRLILNQQNNSSSQNRFELNISDLTAKRLYEILISSDIFGNMPFVVLNVPKTKISDIEDFIKIIKKTPKETVLVIAAQDTLTKTNEFIKNAKEFGAKVITNEKIKSGKIFELVDSLMNRNKKHAHMELKKLVDEDADPFYVISMIAYGIRSVASATEPNVAFLSKSPYVKNKALSQAKNFSRKEILEMYQILYETDKKMKTGQINVEVALPYLVEKFT